MLELRRLNTVEDFKKIEKPMKRSKYILRHVGNKGIMAFWTITEPLVLMRNNGEKEIIQQWFINDSDELIWSNDNDYFNLRMYSGLDTPSSFIADAYQIVDAKED